MRFPITSLLSAGRGASRTADKSITRQRLTRPAAAIAAVHWMVESSRLQLSYGSARATSRQPRRILALQDAPTQSIPFWWEWMDYVIDLDPKRRVLRVTVTTALTEEACTDLHRTIERLAASGGPYAEIFDRCKVPDSSISSRTVRFLAAANPAIPAERPRVIVASQLVMYGLTRMFELSRDSIGGQLQVVRSVEEAYALLDVCPEDFTRRVFPKDQAPEPNPPQRAPVIESAA